MLGNLLSEFALRAQYSTPAYIQACLISTWTNKTLERNMASTANQLVTSNKQEHAASTSTPPSPGGGTAQELCRIGAHLEVSWHAVSKLFPILGYLHTRQPVMPCFLQGRNCVCSCTPLFSCFLQGGNCVCSCVPLFSSSTGRAIRGSQVAGRTYPLHTTMLKSFPAGVLWKAKPLSSHCLF